jgi:uncharacterized protein involved in exopolysaccharide biosynthesis
MINSTSVSQPGLVAIFRIHWKLLFLGVVLATMLGSLAAFTKKPVYRSIATLMPTSDSAIDLGNVGGLGALAQMTGILPGSGTKVNEARAILTSRRFVEQFVSSNELMTDLFKSRWDPEKRVWEKSWLNRRPPSEYDAYRKMRDDVMSLVEDSKNGVLYLRVDWMDPKKASLWANLLVSTLNEEMRVREVKESDDLLQRLEFEYSRASSSEVRQSLARSLEQATKRKAMASVTHDFAFKVIDPARSPEAKDFVSPNRLMYVLISPFIGFFLVLSFIHLRELLYRFEQTDR